MRDRMMLRPATFAGASIEVGTYRGQVYCFGLVKFGTREGLWTRLVPVSDDTYKAQMPNGKWVESKLEFAPTT
ncbi:MAG: hypothetical protein RLZZ360_588 [Candidatus Parcubacteria bacterium]|jgi:hypothetical protein